MLNITGTSAPEEILPAQQMLVQSLLSDGPARPDLLQPRADLQPDKQDESWKTPFAPTTFNPPLGRKISVAMPISGD
jgi:hypothetical protein